MKNSNGIYIENTKTNYTTATTATIATTATTESFSRKFQSKTNYSETNYTNATTLLPTTLLYNRRELRYSPHMTVQPEPSTSRPGGAVHREGFYWITLYRNNRLIWLVSVCSINIKLFLVLLIVSVFANWRFIPWSKICAVPKRVVNHNITSDVRNNNETIDYGEYNEYNEYDQYAVYGDHYAEYGRKDRFRHVPDAKSNA